MSSGIRVGQAGLGEWGKNLARNFADLAELVWLTDPADGKEPEFAARDRGYTFVSHQQEVGTGYFDEVTQVIQGGHSSTTAMHGSTEEEQFDTGGAHH